MTAAANALWRPSAASITSFWRPLMKSLRTLAFGLVGLLSLALLTAEAAADAKGKGKKGDVFKMLDANNDDKISKDEFGKGKGKGSDKAFQKLDANNDGFLTKDEFAKGGKKKKKD